MAKSKLGKGLAPSRRPGAVVVDDSQLMRKILKDMLEKSGFDLAGEAADGLAGLKVCVATCPDVVIVDAGMPGADELRAGIAALKVGPLVVLLSDLPRDELPEYLERLRGQLVRR